MASIDQIAALIIQKRNIIKEPSHLGTSPLMFWAGTHWQYLTKPVLENLIFRFQEDYGIAIPDSFRVVPHQRKALLDLVWLMAKAPVVPFNEFTNYVPLKNGIYNIQNKRLEENTPLNPHKYFLPVNYGEGVSSDSFDRLIDNCVDQEDLLNFLAYCLLPDTRFKKALICHGSGDSGKTTLIQGFIDGVIGELNSSSLTFRDINSRFGAASLVGKAVNYIDEVGSADEINASDIKKMVNISPSFNIDVKNENAFTAKLDFKLIITTNEMPRFKGLDKATEDRFIYCRFKRNNKEIDRELGRKLIKEAPGVLHILLPRLSKLICLPSLNQSDSAKKAFSLEINPSHKFYVDFTKEVEGAKLPIKRVVSMIKSELGVSVSIREFKSFCETNSVEYAHGMTADGVTYYLVNRDMKIG